MNSYFEGCLNKIFPNSMLFKNFLWNWSTISTTNSFLSNVASGAQQGAACQGIDRGAEQQSKQPSSALMND